MVAGCAAPFLRNRAQIFFVSDIFRTNDAERGIEKRSNRAKRLKLREKRHGLTRRAQRPGQKRDAKRHDADEQAFPDPRQIDIVLTRNDVKSPAPRIQPECSPIGSASDHVRRRA